jgi:dGTPase
VYNLNSKEGIDMQLRKIRLSDSTDTVYTENREEYERDYARLIQSPSFRRLQGKSQVFGAGTGDYYRTRLTHSIEVSQIAREVARRLVRAYPSLTADGHPGLVIEPEVVECASLAHDLGHPPFGHKGEDVLNQLLRDEFGMCYEGNAQNYRILMFLEKRAGSDIGLDLTSAVLLAINKYPFDLGEPGRTKGLYTEEWTPIKQLRAQWGIPGDCLTLEAQLMDLCDDIAYSTHDIEDGVRAGKIVMSHSHFDDSRLVTNIINEIVTDKSNFHVGWEGVDMRQMVSNVLQSYLAQWERVYVECGREMSKTRREMKAIWVGKFANEVGIIDDPVHNWKRVTFVKDGVEDHELLRTMEILKKLAWVNLVRDFRVQRLQKRSDITLRRLWDTFKDYETAKLILPPAWMTRYEQHKDVWSFPRLVADYIAGMTDSYAEKVCAELFSSRSGSIYERD